jgi:hypothetical protein
MADEVEGAAEIALSGGNTSTVTRVGNTVRRSAGAWTPAVHALLRHLEGVGFAQAPRALGMDDKGREVLSYIEGQVFPYPMPAFVWTDATLIAAARLLSSYHEAQNGFEPPADAHWRVAPGAPSHGPTICHNDTAPYNTVFVHEQPFALIDWDFAAPGSALWDVAYAVWFYVPLTDDPNIPALDKARRLRLFCDTYGLHADDRAQLLSTIHRRQKVAFRTLREWGSAGVPGFAEMWQTGHAEAKLRDIATLKRNWGACAAALDG